MSDLARALIAALDDDALDELAKLLAPRLAKLAPRPPGPDAMMTISAAARRAGCSPQTLRRAIHADKLQPAGYVGPSPRLTWAEVERWLQHGRGRDPRPRTPHPTTRRNARPLGDAFAKYEGAEAILRAGR